MAPENAFFRHLSRLRRRRDVSSALDRGVELRRAVRHFAVKPLKVNPNELHEAGELVVELCQGPGYARHALLEAGHAGSHALELASHLVQLAGHRDERHVAYSRVSGNAFGRRRSMRRLQFARVQLLYLLLYFACVKLRY